MLLSGEQSPISQPGGQEHAEQHFLCQHEEGYSSVQAPLAASSAHKWAQPTPACTHMLLPFGRLENIPGGLDAKVHNGGTAATLTATTP